MITYELAKHLKDAGFPQNGKNPSHYSDGSIPYERDPKDNMIVYAKVYIPLLDELIEACVKINHDYTFHLENIKDNVKWFSGMRYFGALIAQMSGVTPEEAVAHLWLELNKK